MTISAGTMVRVIKGYFVGVIKGGTGWHYITDGRMALEYGSMSFGHGSSALQTTCFKGVTKAQLQLKSKEVSTQALTRMAGFNWGTGSYQTWEEEFKPAATSISLTYAPMTDLIAVYAEVNDDEWERLSAVVGAPNVGEYAISDSTITINADGTSKKHIVRYTYNNTSEGTRALLPLGHIPDLISGSFRLDTGEDTSSGKKIFLDWYFQDLQATTDKIDYGSAHDNFGDDYTETWNVSPNSLLYASIWQEP